MKKWALLIGYCMPYVFLAMYMDAAWGTMIGYGGMIAAYALLTWATVRLRGLTVCAAGHGFSLLFSLVLSGQVRMERWRWYFKPFGANAFLCVLSAVVFAVQMIFAYRRIRTTNIDQ